MVFITKISLTSCALFQSQQTSSIAVAQSDDYEEDNADYSQEDAQSNEDTSNYDSDDESDEQTVRFPHPEVADAANTFQLLQINRLPDAVNLRNCQDSIKAIAEDATNQEAMISVQNEIATIAKQDLDLYHWCFYQLMIEVDQNMAKNGLLMEDRAQIFFDGMRHLWVMSRALDRLHKSQKYFTYLRKRYLQISQNSFGRQLKVVGDPLNKENMFFRKVNKPAGPADTD